MKAQKKPIIIDYYPIKKGLDIGELEDWMKSFGDNFKDHLSGWDELEIKIKVKTLEGISYNLTDEDVLIRGIKGEYYPCKKDIFVQTYDLLSIKNLT